MIRTALALCLTLSTISFAADPIDLTVDEFKMYRHWKAAMEDERVQKMKPEARDAAIAKDAHYKLKDMQKAVAKGEAAGDLKSKCEALLKDALAQSPVKDQIRKVDVDATEPHAVAYIEWANDNVQNLEEEASMIAAQTRACPILSSDALWATDKTNARQRVWQGIISQSAADKIAPDKAKDFADTRYIRLFEKVKNLANGDDLTQPEGAARDVAGNTPPKK